jgi:hypothetical protein
LRGDHKLVKSAATADLSFGLAAKSFLLPPLTAAL